MVGTSCIAAILLWMAQPPLGLWPLVLIALTPLVNLVVASRRISRRGYFSLWGVMVVYWLLSLQGLRHAHWAMYFCWFALACYLAVYSVLFLVAARWMVSRRVSLLLAVAVAWTGMECVRGYLLTGLSACMLGHALADVSAMIQIADLFGTYGISFVIAATNVAAWQLGNRIVRRLRGSNADDTARSIPATSIGGVALDVSLALTLVGASLIYGQLAGGRASEKQLGNFALVQRNEPVEYDQPIERASEIFFAYAQQTIRTIGQSDEPVDAILWPESMFTANNPWMIVDSDAVAPSSPQGPEISVEDLKQGVTGSRALFLDRAEYVLGALEKQRPRQPTPHLIVGSGVVRYGQTPEVYCGVLQITPQRQVQDWYAKTHLVMFGEYVPILPHIPVLRSLVPPGLGLKAGSGAKCFQINGVGISPNVCIETAVERVTVQQFRQLRNQQKLPDLIVTVTNDGWFDDSSVIDHHRRCAQLVAVSCRRPILSAANNGPTVWIDSDGQVVDGLPTGSNGVLLAKPRQDRRTSLYVKIGDWPARICALASLLALAASWRERRSADITISQQPAEDMPAA